MNNRYQLKIVIASDIDYECLVAEIYCNGEFFALLQQEEGVENIKVEFSPSTRIIDLDWLQYALSKAKEHLLNN
ncbi:hypothetical protein GPY51_22615 [Photorhabdus laumondii subsp. laumondii]|uniref:Photorhabdus luminescens subsp. laumondii TTO1 complete genome segment 13/17 n=3 Tax=Photorhabdus TaxID=29487 RepID=Q7N1A6_PHOLL|nr:MULTISPECIES: hypothetical protein [Photorhabdus]AWK43212.1 hypothetical protein A4R40_17780 [Photorhabdus laumondii subsp. laumondii]AXG43886.1 hypothetical protein PluDJC_17650 [Photorhabdus laumondii subsp. laumondii]AXG48523.1 hypothetical protein PluTT01m_18345 [Photorhabdus laumondii subsp. laumondii]KAA1183181.1 hypothetical protein F0L16_16360 [Photorhabdus heterorhabditis]KTL61821.1 hypothetical protein AA106_21885 [Photorhabdus laumondii subsp. laumondii]